AAPGLGPFIDTSTPVVAEGLVMFGTFAFDFFSGDMVALDVNTGAVVWDNFIPGGAVGTSPAYNNGTVFVSTWDGNLYAWEASTGTLLQQLSLSPRGSSSSVALADGYLVVGDQAGGIDGFSFVGAGVAATVSVNPPTADVAVTSGVVLNGQAQDIYGNTVGGASFSWSSMNGLGTVLPVSPSGGRAIYIAATVAGVDDDRQRRRHRDDRIRSKCAHGFCSGRDRPGRAGHSRGEPICGHDRRGVVPLGQRGRLRCVSQPDLRADLRLDLDDRQRHADGERGADGRLDGGLRRGLGHHVRRVGRTDRPRHGDGCTGSRESDRCLAGVCHGGGGRPTGLTSGATRSLRGPGLG